LHQSASLIKMSILIAVNRGSECSVAAAPTSAAVEVPAARIGNGNANRNAPKEAASKTTERTIAEEALARYGQFKR